MRLGSDNCKLLHRHQIESEEEMKKNKFFCYIMIVFAVICSGIIIFLTARACHELGDTYGILKSRELVAEDISLISYDDNMYAVLAYGNNDPDMKMADYLENSLRNIDERRMSVKDYLEFVNTKIEVRKNWPELYDVFVTTDNYREIENAKNLTKAMEDGISSGRYTIKDKEALIERLIYNRGDVVETLHFLLTWAYTPEQSLEILIIDVNSPKNNFIDGIKLNSNQSIEDLLIQKLDNATEFEDISYYIDALNKHYKDNNIKSSYINFSSKNIKHSFVTKKEVFIYTLNK